MPLTLERIKQIQDECLADDIDVPPESVAWTEDEAFTYFESGGSALPQIGSGFAGAEIHAFYELKQRHIESMPSDSMVDALSAALFKTTGDSKFKPSAAAEELPQAAAQPKEQDYATRERKPYEEPEQKYAVPKLGEFGSVSFKDDDTTPL